MPQMTLSIWFIQRCSNCCMSRSFDFIFEADHPQEQGFLSDTKPIVSQMYKYRETLERGIGR
jgi:hypothetical protein